jgi:hypothetical protein
MRVCPNCQNDDPRLMEPRFFYAYTMWLCIVCSRTWRTPVERIADGSSTSTTSVPK